MRRAFFPALQALKTGMSVDSGYVIGRDPGAGTVAFDHPALVAAATSRPS